MSLSQRIDGERPGQAIGLSRCQTRITTEVRVAACHHALYFVRRRPSFCRCCSASPLRTFCRRTDPARGSPIRAEFFGKLLASVAAWQSTHHRLRSSSRTQRSSSSVSPSRFCSVTVTRRTSARALTCAISPLALLGDCQHDGDSLGWFVDRFRGIRMSRLPGFALVLAGMVGGRGSGGSRAGRTPAARRPCSSRPGVGPPRP